MPDEVATAAAPAGPLAEPGWPAGPSTLQPTGVNASGPALAAAGAASSAHGYDDERDDDEPPKYEVGPLRRCIAMLGARAVGKTAISLRLVDQAHFRKEYAPTIEDTYRVRLNVDDTEHVLTILDTAGQDDHTPISASYTVGVDGYIMLFDVNRMDSFRTIQRVEKRLMQTLCVHTAIGTTEIPRVLVGNKVDDSRERSMCEVTRDEAEAWAKELQIPYFECSALTGSNVPEIFCEVLRITSANHFWDAPDDPMDFPPRTPSVQENSGPTAASAAAGIGETETDDRRSADDHADGGETERNETDRRAGQGSAARTSEGFKCFIQ